MKVAPRRWLTWGTLLFLALLCWHYAPFQTWPALLALGLVLSTRNAALGLAVGAFSGCLLIENGALGASIKSFTEVHFFGALSGPWHVSALLFTLLLGSFAALIERSGGFQSLIGRLTKSKTSNPKRRLQLGTILTGCLCFFDGLANAVLLGRLYRPLYDKAGISRDKLAYLVDTTSSAVACIAFVSTWIATQLSLIQEATAGQAGAPSAYQLFLNSIPYCFYCTSSLVLAIGVVTWNWNPGPMAHSESAIYPKNTESNPSQGSGAWRAVLPIGVLVVAIISGFYLWDTSPILPISLEKIQSAFSGNAGPYALSIGALAGCIAAWLCLPKSEKSKASKTASKGAASMLAPLLILVLAWSFGSVLKALGTAQLLAQLLQSGTPILWLPAAVFVTASLTSFLTGSSWGTMSLFMPIALPVFLELGGDLPNEQLWNLAPAVIGAVFGGAVFGDHCSPFSDTTIVSAVAAGTPPTQHIRTQLPYAITAATLSIALGYALIALGLTIWVALPLVLGSSLLVPYLGTKWKSVGSKR